jgi:aryl-alcohol dehydrogenase-like predicted oxidoreductase
MRYRTFGRAGFEVSDVGFGAWGIGGRQWIGADDAESLRALRRAIDLGLNFIDTALAYGDGHSETLVGRAARECGRRLYIATKVPPKNMQWPARAGVPIDEVFPYEYIMRSTEQSLRNLGVEAVDLQQLHVWNPEWFARDDWRRAFEELKRTGKARAVGVSINDHAPDSAIELVESGLVDSVQVIHNIFDQTPESRLLPLCRERGVAVLSRVPLDEGGLTGAIGPGTRFPEGDFREWYFRGERKRQVAERVAALREDLAGVNGTLAQTALRFCLSHPAVTSVIPGMRKVANVESSCAASDLGPLDAAVLGRLRKHAWPRNFYL